MTSLEIAQRSKVRESAASNARALELIEKAKVPTLPAVAVRTAQLASDPEAKTAEIVSLVSSDPSLTARVLKLVNSAYYAVPRGVSDVRRAVSYLGLDTLHQLVLTVAVVRALPRLRDGSPLDAGRLWQHALATALLARDIGRRQRLPVEELFTGGLLHDIGKIISACADPEGFARACDDARERDISLFDAERARDGRGPRADHEQVGRVAARRWRLPPRLVACIGFHHAASGRGAVSLIGDQRTAALVVGAADYIARYAGFGDGCSTNVGEPSEGLLEEVRVRGGELDLLAARLPNELARWKSFLELLHDPA
ncbi:MAG: HDOD domain-containing protein [Myxococcales bacterium]|nr:HDOD domain-containing protein [Myxococcales bacterium]